jgi:7,8-dihydropterin-6-yl-methyl-4-(beta-D-ribofuranosyl)aminobenzene 5'-phosphate synthase
VLSSCSHRGIVNAVKKAVAASGINKVHAVLGGFHLAPHKPEYVRDTVKALKELNPDAVMPMHCTGEAFVEIMQQEMPGKLVRSYTGSRYVFGT